MYSYQLHFVSRCFLLVSNSNQSINNKNLYFVFQYLKPYNKKNCKKSFPLKKNAEQKTSKVQVLAFLDEF